MTDTPFADEIPDAADAADAAKSAASEARARLREKIDEARERGAEIADTAAQKARDFVHEHPVATVAGGIVLGALVAGALTRRRAATPQSAATRAAQAVTQAASPVAGHLARLATVGAELALAYAARAADKGKEGVGKLEDVGEAVSERLSEGSAEARKQATALTELVFARANEFLGKLRR